MPCTRLLLHNVRAQLQIRRKLSVRDVTQLLKCQTGSEQLLAIQIQAFADFYAFPVSCRWLPLLHHLHVQA